MNKWYTPLLFPPPEALKKKVRRYNRKPFEKPQVQATQKPTSPLLLCFFAILHDRVPQIHVQNWDSYYKLALTNILLPS